MFAVSFAQNVVLRPLLFAENVVSLIALFAVLSLDVCSSLQLAENPTPQSLDQSHNWESKFAVQLQASLVAWVRNETPL